MLGFGSNYQGGFPKLIPISKASHLVGENTHRYPNALPDVYYRNLQAKSWLP